MKVAIVHELLTRRGGAEKVAKIFADMFPDAPIYTLLYDETKLGEWFPKERVRTSELQKRAEVLSMFKVPRSMCFNHHLSLRRFPAAVEAWDFSEFDLVISSSSAFAHGIITNGEPKHLCYVHSPARYLWDSTHAVLERASEGLLGSLKRRHLEKTFHKLRLWDAESAPRPDVLLANSNEVSRRCELYWRRDSTVIHPPIDQYWLDGPLRSSLDGDGYLIVSTLARYKNIDIAIDACNALGVPLRIVGEGPDRRRLQKLAGSTVTFLGYQPTERVRELYAAARGVLFPGEDDFGLVPLEANACGAPVIALRAGGARETVIHGKTGAFFTEPTAGSLRDTLKTFDPAVYSPEICREHAQHFSRENFEMNIREEIEEMML